MIQQIKDTKDGMVVRTVKADPVGVSASTGPMLTNPAAKEGVFIRGDGHIPADVAHFALKRFWPTANNNTQVVVTDHDGMVLHPPQPMVDTRARFGTATVFHVYLTYVNP